MPFCVHVCACACACEYTAYFLKFLMKSLLIPADALESRSWNMMSSGPKTESEIKVWGRTVLGNAGGRQERRETR